MSKERNASGGSRKLFGHLVATRPPREGGSALAATAASIGFHTLLVCGLIWATMSVARPDQATKEERLSLYTPIPEAPPPPPPVAPRMDVPRPAVVQKVIAQAQRELPQVKPVAVDEPKGFKVLAPPTVTPPDIPPPSMGPAVREADYSGEGAAGGSSKGSAPVELAAQKLVTAEDISAAPTFTPYTVSPRLKNRDEVARALQRYYPDMLRDAGVGGKVLVWFLIDERGKVEKFQVKESSGHDALDQAALRVADVMEFTPALNRDHKVPVWVALPIEFSSKGGE
ncbi:MAG TPA: TonB family protein [Longimicrobiales bacterium]